MKVPEHVAIILDGNRRYAKKNNLSLIEGHKAGAKKVIEFLEWCKEFKIKEATLYSFSTENLKRTNREITYLMNLFREQLIKLKDAKILKENEIKVRFAGNLSMFPKDIIDRMEEITRLTANNDKFLLNIAMGYGSREEILNMVREISKKVKSNEIDIKDINEDIINKNLYIRDDVDFFIRPGGEKRMSNFLLWQCSYAELYFTEKLWPEFSKEDWIDSLKEFSIRERKFGV